MPKRKEKKRKEKKTFCLLKKICGIKILETKEEKEITCLFQEITTKKN
jgi:hypothetical protein